MIDRWGTDRTELLLCGRGPGGYGDWSSLTWPVSLQQLHSLLQACPGLLQPHACFSRAQPAAATRLPTYEAGSSVLTHLWRHGDVPDVEALQCLTSCLINIMKHAWRTLSRSHVEYNDFTSQQIYICLWIYTGYMHAHKCYHKVAPVVINIVCVVVVDALMRLDLTASCVILHYKRFQNH